MLHEDTSYTLKNEHNSSSTSILHFHKPYINNAEGKDSPGEDSDNNLISDEHEMATPFDLLRKTGNNGRGDCNL